MEGLLGQLNDFSYNIPVVNVTITKDVALSYAKTHAENGGPIFALVLLILFGVVMTLIWLYLILSACCCCCFDKPKKNNWGATQSSPRISPRSPTSPSHSSAPLKRKGGAPLSSVERDNDEDPMRQTVSLEREHRRYSFSCFYVVSILVSICLGICVAGVFVYQSKFDASAKTFLGDVEELMLDSADAMCTANAGSSACTAQSAGMFVSTAENQTTGVLGSLVYFLAAIDDDLYPSLNATIEELAQAGVDLDSIEAYTDSINANITLIQQYKDMLRASAPEDEPTPLTSALPQGALPVVTADQLAAVEDGRKAVATARSNAEEVYGTISNFVATVVAQSIAEFNTSTPSGTTTQKLIEPLGQISNSILQGRDMALKYHHLANEQGEKYTGYLTQKTWAVILIFLLPFLLQIIMIFLNRSYSKSAGHLLTSMCCNYFCLLFFIILAMVFSLLAAASSTVCEYHLELVAKVPTQNVTLNDVQVSITPAAIEDILHCPASPFTPSSVTPDNNFIGILGAEGLFNISSQTDEAIARVEEARTSFNPEAQIQDAIKELDSLGASTAFNVSEGNNILSNRTEVLDLLAVLPPAIMDRDNATQRGSLAKYFIMDPDFSWDDYQASLTAVNTLLVGATGIPPGFLSAYSFQTAWNFTQATVADEPLWENVVFRPPTDLDDLMDGLANADPSTEAVNSAVASNVEVRTNLTAVLQALDGIQSDVDSINAVQLHLANIQTQLNGTLHNLLVLAQGILTGLTAQEDQIRSLAAFVSTAPEYTKCGFVGEFYHEGFQEGFCGDLHDSLSIMWPFMLAASLCLFVSFVTFSCFVRKPRWFRDSDYTHWQDRNSLTPGRTPRGAAFMLA